MLTRSLRTTVDRLVLAATVAGALAGPLAAQQTASTADGAAAPSASADAPAARRAAEIAALIDAGDPAEAERYIRANYAPDFLSRAPIDVHLAFLARRWDSARGLTIGSIEAEGPTEAVVAYRAHLTDRWSALGVQVEARPPHRITGLRPARARAPAEAAAATEAPPAADAARALDAYVRRLVDADVFSGGVLVARGGEVRFEEAYGLASREFGVPNTVDTRFILGSINKMFTAVGILQQLERGRISLDDPVAKHLPGVLRDDLARKVRIRHLLTHTSGLDDFLFTPEMRHRSRADFRTIADYLPLLADDTLRFEPGTDWSYSNTGFLVLGAVLEQVSGQDYYDYVREHIFEPAGMTATASPELDLVPRDHASTYEKDFVGGTPRFRSDRFVQVARGTPAGGGFSTLRDMLRFAEALRTNRLLDPETTRMMLSPKPELGSPGYGFGAQIFDGSWVGHTGGGPGTGNYFGIDLETGTVVVVLANMRGETFAVVERAQRLFAGS